MPRTRSLLRPLALVAAVALAGCLGDSPTGPSIEKTTFDPSLGIDLDDFTRLPSGLYYDDIVVGSGTQATIGSQVSVRYSGALTNGTVFDSGGPTRIPTNFVLGAGTRIYG